MKNISPVTFPQKLMTFFVMILNIPAAASVDLYSPSIPAMMHYFHSLPGPVQLSIPIYLLGMAASQWLCGFLSDTKGRKKVFLTTAMIFLIGSVVCIIAHNIYVLLLGRLLQGIGAGMSAMICPAIIGESIEPARVEKVSTYFGMTYAMIPIFAPLIGGLMQHHFGWQSNFMVLLGIMLFATIAVALYLPETCQTIGQKKFHPAALIKVSWQVLCHRPYLRAVLALTALWSLIPIFSIIAPFVIQHQLHRTAAEFGLFAMIVGIGFFIGNFLSGRLQKIVTSEKLINNGLLIMILASIVQITLMFMQHVNLITVIAPLIVIMIAFGICFPSVYAQAVTAHTENIGVAGALLGCCILIGASSISICISYFHVTSATGLGFGMGICGILAYAALRLL